MPLPPSPQSPRPGGATNRYQAVLGDRMPRYSRLLDKMNQSSVIFKVPSSFGADEHNVIFGLGGSGAMAAGASFQFSQNAPRDLILRKLVAYDANSLTNGAVFVTSITVEGNTLLLGSSYPLGSFLPGAFHAPEFDIPVAGGTPVQVTVQTVAAIAAPGVFAGFMID